MRKIIHIDMDAFYASVEQRENPALKGRPVAVGGKNRRGVVAAASYEARKFGVRSAMPVRQALELCPDLQLVRPNFPLYQEISRALQSFYGEYTDIIEPLSLDECYLDVSRNKKDISSATEIAHLLRDRIRRELNLTASCGVAPNKLLAKIASDINKPDGIFVIKPADVEEFMLGLPVKKIWGVGKVTYGKLQKMHIKTCADLQKIDKFKLQQIFGKYGDALYLFCRGIDDREVSSYRESKSIGAERTLMEDISGKDEIWAVLETQMERVIERLMRSEFYFRTVTVKIKYADFQIITRSASLSQASRDKDLLAAEAKKIINNLEIGKKIRLVGVSISNLQKEVDTLRPEAEQQLLFSDI